jgi:phosphoribosylanthranilate isomerase
MTKIKICGITTQTAIDTCEAAGADYIGFVFYERSARYIKPADTAGLKTSLKKVGLFVDPSLTDIAQVLEYCELDIIQLHGGETTDTVQLIKQTFHKPVMKAIAIESEKDLEQIPAYEALCDWLLFDTKTSDHGGSGISFDWSLLQGYAPKTPWMLAGGLNKDNISDALRDLSPDAVDVSSGVELEKGVKDDTKIKEFIEAVHQAR